MGFAPENDSSELGGSGGGGGGLKSPKTWNYFSLLKCFMIFQGEMFESQLILLRCKLY